MQAASEIAVSNKGARQYQVRAATDSDADRWNEFILCHTEATFFHRIEWAEVLRRAFGHRSYYLIAECAGEIGGVLPLAEVKCLLFGHALISTPFCVYGGIIATNEHAYRALQSAACELARQLGVDYLEMRNMRRRHPEWPMKDLYYTFRREISADSEKNMLAIPRKQRAMVRKGMQKGLRIRMDADVRDLYRMYSESLRNLGTPVFSRNYLQLLRDIFADDAEILTVLQNDAVVSSVLSFRFRDEILPYYGGGSNAARAVAANDYMYWQVMERARGQGLKVFDFGRSKRDSGAFEFKCHWGFEPRPLYYEYYLVKAKHLPNLSPSNPKYRAMIRTWQRLPLSVANAVGQFVAPYLG